MSAAPPTSGIVDAWVNPTPAEVAQVWQASPVARRTAEEFFKEGARVLAGIPVEDMIAEMDAGQVTGAVLSFMANLSPWPDDIERYFAWGAALVAAHPGRFVAAGGVDPHTGMTAVRQLESMVQKHGYRALKLMPALVGAPPNDRIYYPIYAKCIELGVPVTLNVGIPGPWAPADTQRPLYLDDVCRFFPELVIVATHVGFPWHNELIGLMLKYPNLHLMTSAWAPRYYPSELVQYMNTRGARRVMFATDWPLLTFERCSRELAALPLRDEVRPLFLRENAVRLFWPAPA